MIYKNIIVFILFNLFSLYNSLNIKMCINNNNNNNYNLPIRRLENGDHNNLILLNNEITSEWCKNWIYEMSLYKKDEEIDYPQFMISDIMSMRIYCETNKEDNFFYIGYVPTNVDTMNGPLYIGAFQLIQGKRIFNFEKIIQNPSNSCVDISTSVIDFRNDLYELGKQTNCIINIKPLKNFSNDRYWLDFNLF
jgi:hypothetical protein